MAAETARFIPHSPRVRTPTVLQMEAVECGAASLAIILAHFGRYVPLEELRAACGVSRDGSKATNVLRAARGYGLIATGWRKEVSELRSLPLPVVVFWNFNHFLVVEGFGPGKVYLNDPAGGPRVVSEQEFDGAYTGVVLTFTPGPDFRAGGAPQRLTTALAARLRGCRQALAFVVLVGLVLTVPGLAVPAFSKVFVDDYLIGGMHSWLWPILLGMGLTAVLRAVLSAIQQRYLLRLQTKLALSTSGTFFWHVLRLPYEFFTQRFGGEIGARVQINDQVAQILSGQLASTVLGMLQIVFYGAVMISYSARLAAVVVVAAALNAATLQYVARRRVDQSRRQQQETSKLTGTAMSGLQMIETLKATGAESDFFNRWAGYQAKVMNASQDLAASNQGVGVVPALLAALSAAAVLGWGALMVMHGQLSAGTLVAFQSLMASFGGPVAGLVGMAGTLQQLEGGMNRLDDVLRYAADPQAGVDPDAAADLAAPRLSGAVELRDVSFGYSRLDLPLIEHFSLTLRPGDRVAIVGGSGSGKSTVAKLVSGLHEPWSGEVLFDGVPRRQVPRAVLHRSVAVVDQDIFMFEGSVRENITLWDETIDDDVVVGATKDASIHGDVAARPGGYGSGVAEGGANFSGGQRQRLEIARALVAQPSVLVLDEATSALDPVTEVRIDESLRRRGCTCLIIAHRLSTIRDCDEIVVMDRGKIVQRGTHDQLMEEGGFYASLIRAE